MKRIVALVTCLAFLIPGASMALAGSTGGTYGQSGVHSVAGSKTCSGGSSSSGSGSSGSGSSSSGSSGSSKCCTGNSGSGSSGSGSSGSSSSGSTCTGSVSETTAGSLPFTGLDLGALAAGAVVLLGAGIVLRRASAVGRS